jgi:hypothetical protein
MQLDIEETRPESNNGNLRKAHKSKSLKRRNQALIGSNFAELKRLNQQVLKTRLSLGQYLKFDTYFFRTKMKKLE